MKAFLKRLILPLKDIDHALPQSGKIVDLGCGEGLVSFAIAQRRARTVIGVDQNKSKINQAKSRVGDQKNINFLTANILLYQLPHELSGCVIADVLHHLSRKSQKQLLTRISRHLKRGGVLVIKEINRLDVIRSKTSRLWDFLLYPHDQINYLSSGEIEMIMKKLGFTVTQQKKHLLVPASINIYICTKQ